MTTGRINQIANVVVGPPLCPPPRPPSLSASRFRRLVNEAGVELEYRRKREKKQRRKEATDIVPPGAASGTRRYAIVTVAVAC